jgi:hypothetical protein
MNRKYQISLTAIAWCLWCTAFAANYPPPTIGEFRRGQLGIGCAQTTPKLDYLACLRIGSLTIGSRPTEIEAVLGKARVARRDEGIEKRFYSFDPANPPAWYVVVNFENDRAIEIQLTGKPSKIDLSFSSIAIGDRTDKLTYILGNPSSRKCLKDGSYELWGYVPFPFAFRVIKGEIAAIKVTAPLGSGKPFIPLSDSEMQSPCRL